MKNNKIFCPFRICPLGAHVDHQLGMVTGFALDRGITLEYIETDNGDISVVSNNMEGKVKFNISDLPSINCGWGDFIVAAIKILSEKYDLKKGFKGTITGSLQGGGLSSSAAVCITYLTVLSTVNEIQLTQQQLIKYAIRIEREFIGVNVGKLDQSCEVYCKKNNLLFLDTLDDTTELIPMNKNMPPFKIAIIYSGVARKLAGSAYNLRVDECKAAAYALKAYAGMDYGKIEDTHLREIPFGIYETYKDKLPVNWRKRAHHYYHEQERVRKGVAAWKKGDIEIFGRMITESGNSSIDYYEAGSEPLKAIHNIMLKTDGIYGGRFSGAGFNGCLMAIVNPDKIEYISEYVTSEYSKMFPEYSKDFDINFCNTADGIEI